MSNNYKKHGRPQTNRLSIARILCECTDTIGLSSHDIAVALSLPQNVVTVTLVNMRRSGDAFEVGRAKDMRYFATAAARDASVDAYAAALKGIQSERRKRQRDRAKADNRPRKPDGVCALIRLASKSEHGFKTDELAGFTRGACTNMVSQLKLKGELFRANLGYNNNRFFDTAERAAAYEAQHGKRATPMRKQRKPPTPIVLTKSPRKSEAVSFKSLPVVNEGKVKVQRLAGFTGDRWGVTGPVVGGWATAGIGRYLETA